MTGSATSSIEKASVDAVEHDPNFEDAENPYAPPRSEVRPELDRMTIGGPGPGVVRFEAISESWGLFRQEMGSWIAVIIASLACQWGVSIIGNGAQFATSAAVEAGGVDRDAGGLIILALTIGFFILGLLVQSYFAGGLFRVACNQVRGGGVRVGDLFTVGDVFGRLVGGTILVGLCSGLGALFCILPGLMIAGRLMLTIPLIVDGRMGAIEAMGQSWNALKGQTWMATGFYLVTSILSGLGVLACCIGVIFTMPLYYLSIATVYRDYFMAKKVVDPWIEPA